MSATCQDFIQFYLDLPFGPFCFQLMLYDFISFFIKDNKKGKKIKGVGKQMLCVSLSNTPFLNGRSIIVNAPNSYVHSQVLCQQYNKY